MFKVQCSKIKRWRPKAHLLTSRVKASAAGAARALAECAGAHLTRLAVQDGDGLDGRRLRQGECCAIQRALAGGRRAVSGVVHIRSLRTLNGHLGRLRERVLTIDLGSHHALFLLVLAATIRTATIGTAVVVASVVVTALGVFHIARGTGYALHLLAVAVVAGNLHGGRSR